MTAHDWFDPRPNGPCRLGEDVRMCAHCGVIQKHYTEHAWMRVVARCWYPPAGRCPGVAATFAECPRGDCRLVMPIPQHGAFPRHRESGTGYDWCEGSGKLARGTWRALGSLNKKGTQNY